MRPALAFLLIAGLYLTALGRDAFDQWVANTSIPSLVQVASTEVLDRNGRLLRAYTVADGRWRLAVKLQAVDPDYVAMLVAYEDKRFYRHNGVDPVAMLRAVGQAIANGRVVSGGSTLTMQVARLLEDGSTGRWSGKLRQLRLALALERRLSKQDILTLYLNRAPFGGNLEGVRAASRAYFGQEPRRLTPAQAALLVALPQSPERRRPDRQPAQALAARDRVLTLMAVKGLLDAETVAADKTETVTAKRRDFPKFAPHLADRALATAPLQSVHRLTVDRDLQRTLQELAITAVQGKDPRLQVAFVVADYQTGDILASVGSARYQADARLGFVDMTRALRSPGSTLKPLVYGMAFDEGLVHPETLIEDRPTAFGSYRPQNFDGKFRGTLRVREALQLSLNLPVVSLTQALGPATLLARLHRAGLDPVLPVGKPGLAIALGGLGLTLEDLVQLYGAIANGGNARPLRWRQSVTDEPSIRILSPESAWQVANILSGIAPPATAARSGLAFKTGTSYGNRDTWALGFDGRHVAGVWMGRADGTPVPGAFGADLAAPILFELFARLKPRLTPLPPPPPATLLVTQAQLPQPLQNFRLRNALFDKAPDAPRIVFPPHGSIVEVQDALILKVADGVAPFTWLSNGQPVDVATYERQSTLPITGAGFLSLSVIDVRGRAAQAQITLR